MNFDSSKNYGKAIKQAAIIISSYDDIYAAAAVMPLTLNAYFVLSRLAFWELYVNIEHNKDIMSKVIDTYILSAEAETHIFNNPDLDKSKEFEFIEHEQGNFFGLMQNIKVDLFTMNVLAHPLEYDKKMVECAMNEVLIPRIKNSPENQAAMEYCLNTLYAKKQRQAQKEKEKYTIKNDALLVDIFQYLQSTGVIDETITLQILCSAIENGDFSGIRPTIKNKFESSLTHIKECLRTQKKKWLRAACSSINLTPQKASHNSSNLGEWYYTLCEIESKHIKKPNGTKRH